MKEKTYRLSKKDFNVGDTCFILEKLFCGRRLNPPAVRECIVTGMGRKYIVVKEKSKGSTYQFDMTDKFLFHDPLYGSTRNAELFRSLSELEERQEGDSIGCDLYNWFRDHNFVSLFDSGTNMIEQHRLISKILDPVNGPELTHFLNECIRTKEKIANGQLSVDSEGNVSIDDDSEYETFEQYFCYKDACISDGFDEIHKAIAHAVLHNYAYVKVHRYYRDNDRDNKIYPDGDPEIVWRNNDPLSVFKN